MLIFPPSLQFSGEYFPPDCGTGGFGWILVVDLCGGDEDHFGSPDRESHIELSCSDSGFNQPVFFFFCSPNSKR